MCYKEIAKKKSMILEILIFISLIIIPYGILGFNLVNLMLLILPLIYISKCKVIYGDKKFMIIWGCYFISAIISLFISSNDIVSVVGISTYFSLGVFYITFNSIMKNDKQKDRILTIMVGILSVLAIGFIILQWIIFDMRISGNIAYANSYALMLLIGIYINGEIKNQKYNNIIEVILTVAILFTGSRTTLICYILFIIARSYKNEQINNKNQILNIIISLIVYLIIDKSVIIAILTLPIIIYISNVIYKIKIRVKMIYIVIIFAISTGFIFLFSANTFDRIKNISLENGSLQERIILFQDATIAIKNNPLGYGINSYENVVSEIGSAFFEVRYVHNALLQIGFEIGILGIVLMLSLFVYGGVLIYRNKKLSYHIVIYILASAHSLMDFDFTFVTIVALWVLLISINSEKEIIIDLRSNSKFEKTKKLGSYLFIACIILLILIEGNIMISKICLNSGNYTLARKILSINPTKDWRVDNYLADTYKQQYDETSDKEDLNKSIILLEETRKKIPNNRTANYNLAYGYKTVGDVDKYIDLMNEIYKYNRFNGEYYNEFLLVVEKLGSETNNPVYGELKLEIEKNFNYNKSQLNSKAKYIKNQLYNIELGK